MILHRLRLTNFRGVAHREITFPDQGVVVVCGPNEIGKSSMLEALDLLLTYRDRSSHRDVKAVKPAHADVGAEVEAEISTGPYRFVYRKRFHKKAKTELAIIEPKREQLSGDDAHERVEAMLDETLDTKLWDAQRVLQSASTTAVNLSGSDALSRALDAAAGETDTAPSGDESLLIDRVDAEYLRYFTGTGRPTGEWKAAIERVTVAEAEVGRCRRAVEDVNERVSRHEALTARLRELEDSLIPATERRDAARTAREALAELREDVRQARLVATAAAATSSRLDGWPTASVNSWSPTENVAQRRWSRCRPRSPTPRSRRPWPRRWPTRRPLAAERCRRRAVGRAGALRHRARRQPRPASRARPPTNWRSESRASTRSRRNWPESPGNWPPSPSPRPALAAIEQQWAAVQRIEAQLQADAATVEFTAPADLDIIVDGQPRTLAPGQGWTQPASAAVIVDVPGVLSVRIDPGASAVTLRADLDAAQQLLGNDLAAAGVEDVAAARALVAQRRALADSRGTHAAKLEGLLAGEDAEVLRTHLAELRAAASHGEQIDAKAAAAELVAADEALRTARAEADTRHKALTAATAALAAATTEVTVARDRLKSADDEFVSVRDQLTMLRASVSDEAVAAQADADAAARRKADEAVTALAERYAAADPTAVEAELTAASDAVETVISQRDAARLELHTLTAELGVIGSEGRQGRVGRGPGRMGTGTCGTRQDRGPGQRRTAVARHHDPAPGHHPATLRRAVSHRIGAPWPGGLRRQLRGRPRHRVDDPDPHAGGMYGALRFAVGRGQGATRHPGPARRRGIGRRGGHRAGDHRRRPGLQRSRPAGQDERGVEHRGRPRPGDRADLYAGTL